MSIRGLNDLFSVGFIEPTQVLSFRKYLKCTLKSAFSAKYDMLTP